MFIPIPRLNGSRASVAYRLWWQEHVLRVRPSGRTWRLRNPNGTRPL